MFTLTKGQALRILRKMVGQLGSEGPAFREYWNTLNHFLEAGILTWDDVPKQTWENGSKKAKYPFTVKYGEDAPDLCKDTNTDDDESDIIEVQSELRKCKDRLESILTIRRKTMAENKDMIEAQSEGNLATRESWDVNKKQQVSDEFHDARESRAMDRDARRRAAANDQVLFNQVVNNQQFLFNQALRHEAVTFKNDNFPFDLQGDQEQNEVEDE